MTYYVVQASFGNTAYRYEFGEFRRLADARRRTAHLRAYKPDYAYRIVRREYSREYHDYPDVLVASDDSA